MVAILQLLGAFVAVRSREPLSPTSAQYCLRRAPHGQRLRGSDRVLLVWMTWLWPSLLGVSRVVQPDTILRWHRAGSRAYWRRKSRRRPGRPKMSRELYDLIQRMSEENPVPTVNPIRWHIQPNRVMLVLDDEYFRADLTCLDRAVALESGTSG